MTKPKENKDKEPEEKTQSDKDITDRIKNGEIEPRLVVEPLSFKLDERNIVYLTSSGQFYLSRFQGTDNDTKEETAQRSCHRASYLITTCMGISGPGVVSHRRRVKSYHIVAM